MRDWEPLMRIVAADPEVKAVTPYVIGRVMVQTEPDQGNPLWETPYLRGIVPRLETNVTVLMSSVVEGTSDVSGKGLLVGIHLAERLGLRPRGWAGEEEQLQNANCKMPIAN